MSWQDLSDREKELDRKIELSGIKLDNSGNCLNRVMRCIGASKAEESFVKTRIALRLRTSALLSDADKQINDVETMLERFKKDDEEWERRGRELGFKF
ncbi:hypothetical protein [Bacteroides acidifaciens]|uniref:hypothetical protein n=1 Tax=Bacteroides acidifaciens TaxID=85831 RepID=UPI002627CC3E|nr:hypothetical protein [Bacteroides acidifaciens]